MCENWGFRSIDSQEMRIRISLCGSIYFTLAAALLLDVTCGSCHGSHSGRPRRC